MRKYSANSNEFYGFYNMADIMNHNTTIFEKRLKKQRRMLGFLYVMVGILFINSAMRDLKEDNKQKGD